MRTRLLFCALLATATACRQESDVQPSPSSLAEEVAGTYRTNVYLDPSRVATPTEQMPYAELKRESDNTVTLVYTQLYPNKLVKQIPNILLSRQPEAIYFSLCGIDALSAEIPNKKPQHPRCGAFLLCGIGWFTERQILRCRCGSLPNTAQPCICRVCREYRGCTAVQRSDRCWCS